MSARPEDRWSPLLPPDDPAKAPREYSARVKVRRYRQTNWHLANLPLKTSRLIRQRFGSTARGWGSIRVQLRMGKTSWATSLFPDKKTGTYLFLIKSAVRKAEDLGAGDSVTVHLRIA